MDTVILGGHRNHLALAAGYHVDDFRRVFLGDVDGEKFDGLTLFAVDFLDDYLWLTYLQLISFAAHCLDEY